MEFLDHGEVVIVSVETDLLPLVNPSLGGDKLILELLDLVRATLLFGSQRAVSVCLRYPIPVGHCQ